MKWKSEIEARSEISKLVSDYYSQFVKSKNKISLTDKINYAGRVFDEKEMSSLVNSALDFWLTSGKYTVEFENSFSQWLNIKHAFLVNSGSSANLLAFAALTSPKLGKRQILPGDEVITVACCFPTTITPIIQYGAVPVFVDISLPEYNIDCSLLENALSKKTKAVILAHTLGNPFNIKAVKEFCEKNDLWLIEDNCDSLGSTYTIDGQTKFTGTWGDIGTSSFYPPHHMTMGEGGCVYTDDSLLAKIILSIRDWGRDCRCPSGVDNKCGHRFDGKFGELPFGYDHKYVYSHFGYNLKATDLQASIGVEQLKKLDAFIKIRKNNWRNLHSSLQQINDKIILPSPEEHSDPSWFGFLISIKENSGFKRENVTQELENNNIQTRLLFSGNITKHPCFDSIRNSSRYKIIGDLENTDFVMNNTFWVGVYPGMDESVIDYISKSIIKVFD